MILIVWLIGGVVGIILVASFLPGPLAEVVRQGIGAVIGTLHTLVQGIQHARAQTLTFWRNQFGEFRVSHLLGGLLLVGAAAALIWAELGLLIPTWASLLPADEKLTAVLPGSPALMTAVAVIVLEALMGFFIFELLGWTGFMRWDQLPKKTRWALVSLCFGILCLLAVLQAGLAIWRTEQLTQMQETDQALFALLQEANTTEAGTAPAGWLDRMAPWFPGLVAFFLPLTTALAAVGLYPVLMNQAALAVAVGGLLPLTLLLALATLILNVASYVGSFLEALLNLLIGAGRVLAERVGGQGQQGPSRPVASVETTRPPQPLVSTQATQEYQTTGGPQNGHECPQPLETVRADHGQPFVHSDSQGPAQGLDAVIEAINPNPLGVDEGLVTQVFGRDDDHVRFRADRSYSQDGEAR